MAYARRMNYRFKNIYVLLCSLCSRNKLSIKLFYQLQLIAIVVLVSGCVSTNSSDIDIEEYFSVNPAMMQEQAQGYSYVEFQKELLSDIVRLEHELKEFQRELEYELWKYQEKKYSQDNTVHFDQNEVSRLNLALFQLEKIFDILHSVVRAEQYAQLSKVRKSLEGIQKTVPISGDSLLYSRITRIVQYVERIEHDDFKKARAYGSGAELLIVSTYKDNVVKFFKEYFSEKGTVRITSITDEFIVFYIENIRKEIIKTETYWEKIEISIVIYEKGTTIGIACSTHGQLAAGFPYNAPKEGSYSDMEPQFSKQLSIYTNELLTKLKAYILHGGL